MWNSDYDVLKEIFNFIAQSAAINSKNIDNKTALMYESEKKGNIDIAELLISKGADVNAKDNYGKTALMYALQFSKSDIVELFISKGADVNAKDNDGKTVLMLLCNLVNQI
jgi:ankyrin repeat protein